MQTVGKWLEQLGLPQYSEVFAQNDVDLEALCLLSDEELEKLGVSLGHRKKLLKAVAELNERCTSAPDGEPIPRIPHSSESRRAEAERRQLTVLFCDMVGFTELASRLDPEVLQRIVRRYEDTCAACVTRYEGYVFQRLGDGIVAFFGYPLAHEGEAERAIRAGLEVIESLGKLEIVDAGQLRVRIGIATGLVVVSPAEKGAVGETMNLASRLQAIAAPGSIVVSERVHRLAGGAFDYEDLGEQTLKGIAKPTHAYRVTGVSEAASRFEAAHGKAGLTPLVGREQELGLLLERWALAQEGEGQVALLSGEPGIGKSRILSALRERLEARGVQALRFQCSPYYVNSALWPSIDNFERALKFGRDESAESKLDKLDTLMVTHYGRPRSDVRFVASMLSIPCEARYGAATMTPQKFKDETLRTLVDLTEAAARKQASIMVYEDVHWADPTTLEVMDLLIDRVKGFPLLMVLTHRPEFQSRWSEHGHVVALNLSKLTRAQSTAMVLRLTDDKALPAELLDEILTKTDGVPLFVEELTKSILESGELKDSGDRYEYAGISHSISIPATLRDSLVARLDRFTPVKEIAQIGATIGREFSYELISEVAPHTKAELDNALTQLTDSGLAFRRGTPPDALYTFKHALVQDAAYDSLLKSRRGELHGRIAAAIERIDANTVDREPELLAHHYTQAGQVAQAIPMWRQAGELALKRMALTDAVSHLRQGLELVLSLPVSTERDAQELGLRMPLGTAWVALKGWGASEVWASLHPSLALDTSLRQSEAMVPVLWGLTLNGLVRGRVAEALPLAQQMLATAQGTGNSAQLVTAQATATVCYFWLGDLQKTLEHADKVSALYNTHQHRHLVHSLNTDPKTVAGMFSSIVTWMLGYPDRAAQLSDEKDAHARRLAHPFDTAYALTVGAQVFDFRWEPDKIRRHAEEAYQLGRENSLSFVSAVLAPRAEAVALIREGKTAEGVAKLRAALKQQAWRQGAFPYMYAVMAEGMASLGDTENALRLIEEVIAEIEETSCQARLHYAEILRLRGWMLSQKGDAEGAVRSYLASLDWAREQNARSWELRTSTSLARLWHAQGKRKEAHDLLNPIYKWFSEGFDTKDLIEAKAFLDELS